jgi:Uma2 family endonuclease
MPRYQTRRDRSAITLEQYERMPEENEYRVELSRGWLVREPLPGARHGLLCASVFNLINQYVMENSLGQVLIETGFRLSLDPPTVRGPDVAFISAARLPSQIPVGFWEQAPDLAIEVLSPSNRRSEVQAKVADYLDAGTLAVWVIDPARRRVTVYRSPGEVTVLGPADLLEGGVVLPGFTVRAGDLIGA